MDKDIENIIPIIQEWASTVPYNIKVYLYGSRINGNPRPDSDLDIAIEFKDQKDIDRWEWIGVDCHSSWEEHLSNILPFKPHVDIHCESEFYIEHGFFDFLATKESRLIFDSANVLPETVN